MVFKGTNRLSLFIDRNTAVYFDSFGIEYIPNKWKQNQRQISYSQHV